MPRTARGRWATALTLVAMLGVAACSDDAEGPDPGPASAELTEPGSTLAVGERATVTRGGGDEVLGVTITEIVEGAADDLAGLGRPEGRNETPFFVHYELELVSGTSPSLAVSDVLSAWAGDDQLTQVAILEPFAACEEETFGANASPGAEVAGCATFVVEEGGAPLDRVQFDDDDDYDAFEGHQVSWKQAATPSGE